MSRRAHWSTFPAVLLTIDQIMKHVDHVRNVVIRRGVRVDLVDDASQAILLGTWRNAKERRYRPNPARERNEALEAAKAAGTAIERLLGGLAVVDRCYLSCGGCG